MTDADLLKILDAHIRRAEEWTQEKIGKERAAAYDLYYGRPLGDEVQGRSQVISHDVAQGIDSSLPQLIKMFAGSDKAVEFTPRGPEDVDAAEQATDGANYIFYSQNNGYLLLHNALKDGLLVKTGCFKWCWEEETKQVEETYAGLLMEQLVALNEDPEVEIVAGNVDGTAPDGQQTYAITVRTKKTFGKVRIYIVPPEELLVAPNSASCLVEDIPFICHAPQKTLSELIEMGYKREDIEAASEGDDDRLFSQERIARDLRTNSLSIGSENNDDEDPSQRQYRYYESYLLVDSDGDGISELRKVCKIGSKIFHNEATDHVPLSFWTPKVMPHEPIGISMADDIADQQILSTVLWRQGLDNIYLTNSPRMGVVEGQVNLDDLLQTGPGRVVRMQNPQALVPIEIPFMAQNVFQMLEWTKQETESRTGVARYIQGFDPDSLNQTKGGMQILQNNAQARLDLYGRNFAECALKPMFRGIQYLMAKHQQGPLVARLRNKFVAVDPRAWATEYDMTINVGLGTGTKDQQMQHLTNIVGLQMQMAQSPYASLVPPKQVYNVAAKLTENAGFKDPSQFWKDPSQPPAQGEQPWPPPSPPPPEIQKAQMQIEADKQKQAAEMQGDQAKLAQEGQLRREEIQMEAAAKRFEAILDAKLEEFKATLKAQTDAQSAAIHATALAQRPVFQERPQ